MTERHPMHEHWLADSGAAFLLASKIAEVAIMGELTRAEWDRLSREEQDREIAKFWAKYDALQAAYPDVPTLNLMDPNDPMWLKVDAEPET
jgi:hypothetical protein